jgi:hypothetical protein
MIKAGVWLRACWSRGSGHGGLKRSANRVTSKCQMWQRVAGKASAVAVESTEQGTEQVWK